MTIPRYGWVVLALALGLPCSGPAGASDASSRPVVLVYHHFVSTAAQLEKGAPIMTVGTLDEQLRYLRDHHIRTLTMAEYVAALAQEGPPTDAVLLTMDDGYESAYALAYPLLKRYGMHATVFVVTSHVGKRNTACPKQPWLTWDECRKMSESGVIDIEAHGQDSHRAVAGVAGGRTGSGPFFTTRMVDRRTGRAETDEAYRARVLDDLVTCRDAIETEMGKPPVAFAWPFGKTNAVCDAAARDAGYEVAFSVDATPPGCRSRTRLRSPEGWRTARSLLRPGTVTGVAASDAGSPPDTRPALRSHRPPTEAPPPVTPVMSRPSPDPRRPFRGLAFAAAPLGVGLVVLAWIHLRRRQAAVQPDNTPPGRRLDS